ncbi:MAG: 30S ribosomal protein S1 [Candidatus Krumholzibacteria bacterium]|nr:30S ribosomal protein S1 [Candidatus Krumholzibacteria bacterium]
MMDSNLGAHEGPREHEHSPQGGVGVSNSLDHNRASRRSPVYAAFEELNAEDAAKEALHYDGGLAEDLVAELEKTVNIFEEGQIVKGAVTEIRENEIIVDVGFKSEGTIPVSEFREFSKINAGDEIDVFLEKLENQDGLVVLSKEKADFFKVWDEIKNGFEAASIMEGRVARRIKGGLVVDLLGVDAFLPGSQIALRQVPNLDDLIGETLNFKIIKINKRRRNIVVSRRTVLEEQRAAQKKTLLGELEIAQVRAGVVKNITDFGAFVDLGGVDGLLHLTDMTWGRISHPSEVVSIGDEIEVKVLDFDKEREKISLGLKQLTPHPWDGVEDRYIVGEKVDGKVVSITDYGAFIELEKGVEGLIHISEMSWTRHIKHPSKLLSIGEKIVAMVLKVDKEHQKISLGLKQTEPDPWSQIEQKYPVGTKLMGQVRNLTNFGAFVELEEGIDGLLHISDMSWAKRVRHPSEMVGKGDVMEVVVLDISQDKKRISLGMKQLLENPWETLAEEYAIDTVTEGTVTRTLDRGVVVELRADVEGFVPVGQLGKPDLRHPEDCFAVGDKLPLRVIKVDPKNKRIVLSVGAYLKGADDEEVKAFDEKFPVRERAESETVEVETSEPPTEDESAPAADAAQVEETRADSEVSPGDAAANGADAPEQSPEEAVDGGSDADTPETDKV